MINKCLEGKAPLNPPNKQTAYSTTSNKNPPIQQEKH